MESEYMAPFDIRITGSAPLGSEVVINVILPHFEVLYDVEPDDPDPGETVHNEGEVKQLRAVGGKKGL